MIWRSFFNFLFFQHGARSRCVGWAYSGIFVMVEIIFCKKITTRSMVLTHRRLFAFPFNEALSGFQSTSKTLRKCIQVSMLKNFCVIFCTMFLYNKIILVENFLKRKKNWYFLKPTRKTWKTFSRENIL